MTIEIGKVEIPIVSEIEDGGGVDVDEISSPLSWGSEPESIAVKHEQGVRTIIISGYLNEELHTESLSIGEQKKEVRILRKNPAIENNLNYREYRGHLMVEEVNIEDSSDSGIVNGVSIEARYLPWPKYYSESEP